MFKGTYQLTEGQREPPQLNWAGERTKRITVSLTETVRRSDVRYSNDSATGDTNRNQATSLGLEGV